MSTRAYQEISDRIVSLLQKGIVPWHKPWNVHAGVPRNLVSKREYNGINLFLLISMGYESPYWLTFRQALKLGGNVKRGEKACPVVFWKKIEPAEEAKGRKPFPVLRYYHMFNLSQCEGLKLEADESPCANGCTPLRSAEQIVDGMPHRPHIEHGFVHAAYSRRTDQVSMPNPERFTGVEEYFSTIFHELTHSTGHSSRLNRKSLMERSEDGVDLRSKEELVAEMGSAFLCGPAGILERTIDNSAAYIGGWIETLTSEPTLVVQAAALAQKAANFILRKEPEEEETEAPTPGPPEAGVCANP